jgi:replicative superfamily II helicase
MEKISWTDHVRNYEVSHKVTEKMNILCTIKRRKANWIGHMLRRKCLLKRTFQKTIEGGIEARVRQGRRSKQLLDYLKKKSSRKVPVILVGF